MRLERSAQAVPHPALLFGAVMDLLTGAGPLKTEQREPEQPGLPEGVSSLQGERKSPPELRLFSVISHVQREALLFHGKSLGC